MVILNIAVIEILAIASLKSTIRPPEKYFFLTSSGLISHLTVVMCADVSAQVQHTGADAAFYLGVLTL